MGTEVVGESKSIEYSTPLALVNPLIEEFGLTRDVCASKLNHKLPEYWTKKDNALTKEISLITNLGYEKNITENGNFTAGLTAKNTNQDVKSLSGNLGFKLKF